MPAGAQAVHLVIEQIDGNRLMADPRKTMGEPAVARAQIQYGHGAVTQVGKHASGQGFVAVLPDSPCRALWIIRRDLGEKPVIVGSGRAIPVLLANGAILLEERLKGGNAIGREKAI